MDAQKDFILMSRRYCWSVPFLVTIAKKNLKKIMSAPHTHTHTCTYIHTYIHTYIYTYIYIYIYIYINERMLCGWEGENVVSIERKL